MESPFKGETGVRRLINAARNSIAGFGEAFRLEDAFRMDVALAAVLVPLALFLDVSLLGQHGPGTGYHVAERHFRKLDPGGDRYHHGRYLYVLA